MSYSTSVYARYDISAYVMALMQHKYISVGTPRVSMSRSSSVSTSRGNGRNGSEAGLRGTWRREDCQVRRYCRAAEEWGESPQVPLPRKCTTKGTCRGPPSCHQRVLHRLIMFALLNAALLHMHRRARAASPVHVPLPGAWSTHIALSRVPRRPHRDVANVVQPFLQSQRPSQSQTTY